MKKIFIFIIVFIVFYRVGALDLQDKPTLVMINPAGHAKNVGRKLVENYERGETFKFAEKLQQELQEKYQVRAILTRFPGEEIVDLQNSSFANRLNVDFYLSLHIYREEHIKPKIFAYHLVYNPMVDLARRIFDPFYFIPLHQAHFMNIQKTVFYGKSIKDVLSMTPYQKRFDFYGTYGIPIKPLCGIVAPSIAIEIGICEEDQWKVLVGPIVESLAFLGHST